MFSYGDDRDFDQRRERSGSGFKREDEETVDAEEIKAAAKPTLHLSSLPPNTSPAVIKGLFAPSPLNVENVRIIPASSNPGERNSTAAIVTLAAETPATDIDTMVSHLQNKYLGFGFNLSISRHLSSAALTGSTSLSINAPSTNLNSLPFGAKPITQHNSLSRAPRPGQNFNRYAPPSSYTSSTPYGSRSNGPPTQVNVQAPSDLTQLKLIHKTVEALLTYGPEFEALLMSRPNIQRDEQWSWLWDSRSTGGVYYRWRLWEILTNAKARSRAKPAAGYGSRPFGDVIFEGQSTWIPPEDGLKFEYTTKIEDFISDEDYNSSDEEDMEEDGGLARRYHDHQRMGGGAPERQDNDGTGYLNPLAKTKLVHLLSRLPDSNSKLRRGDVARVTGFAIEHAGAGADEIVALITRNVIQPFCFTVKKSKTAFHSSDEEDEGSSRDPQQENDGKNSTASPAKDITPTSLVGLYLISDILSCSASSGVRHAWRYRSLFETQIRVQNIFPILGRAERRYNWGKLKADKWRRSVQSILSLWEGWCVFPQDAHDAFVQGFLNPPLTAAEKEELEKKEKEGKEIEKSNKEKNANLNRWRSVDDSESTAMDIEMTVSGIGSSYNDIDGTPMNVDSDLNGRPMQRDNDSYADDDDENDYTDADIDGVPMLDSSDEEGDGATAANAQAPRTAHAPSPSSLPPSAPPPPPPPPSGTAADPTDITMKDHDEPTTQTHPQRQQKSPTTATTGSDAVPKTSQSTTTATASSSTPGSSTLPSQARRSRPRAADFDDMFG